MCISSLRSLAVPRSRNTLVRFRIAPAMSRFIENEAVESDDDHDDFADRPHYRSDRFARITAPVAREQRELEMLERDERKRHGNFVVLHRRLTPLYLISSA